MAGGANLPMQPLGCQPPPTIDSRGPGGYTAGEDSAGKSLVPASVCLCPYVVGLGGVYVRRIAVKPPVLVGIVIAVLIVVAGLMAPLMVSASTRSAAQAQRQAALALREVARVSVNGLRLKSLVDPAAITADEDSFGAAVENSMDRLREIGSESGLLARKAREKAQATGAEVSEPETFSADAAGVRRALGDFKTALKANDALLSAAIADAQTAVRTNGQALGVPQVLGMAQHLKAVELFHEAQALRDRQAAKQAELLVAGAQWKQARGKAGYFRGLDVAPMLTALRQDLEELADLRADADARVAALAAQVSQRKAELQQVEEQMQATRQALLEHEAQGFTVGDDASFDAYRTRYRELSNQLKELQERQQQHRHGGRPGAEFVGEQWATAEIEGGERVEGLEELQWRLATAEVTAERLTNANVLLDEHIQNITQAGRQAQTQSEQFQSRLSELDTRQEGIMKELLELAGDALKKEDEALRAADAAARAFKQAQSGAEKWVRDARQTQQDRDPQRKNSRLSKLVGDPYVLWLAKTDEAAALVLKARIHALRLEFNQGLIDDVDLFMAMNPDPTFAFDPEAFLTAVETARAQGLEDISRARDIYQQMAEQGPVETRWVPQAALAAAYSLSARLDETQATSFLQQAADWIGKAVDKREQNPYLRTFVQFFYHLGGPGVAPEVEEDAFFGEEES